MSKSLSIVSLAALALVAGNASAQYLANGGFEIAGGVLVGAPSGAEGWQGASTVPAARVVNPALARTGDAYLSLAVPNGFGGSVGLQNGVASAGLPPMVGGELLTLSLWAAGDVGPTGNLLFSLRYLNAGGTILYNSGNIFMNGLSQNYQNYTFTPPAAPAGTAAAFLEISTATGPGATDVRIDDVSLVAIPEPSTLGLASVGLLALARRRRA
jgi:hypothetical protein